MNKTIKTIMPPNYEGKTCFIVAPLGLEPRFKV